MGLLDYYRQFEDIDESEFNLGLRQRRAQEKALALEQIPLLDLSGTEWPEFPHAEVVSEAVYAARGRINGYPDRHATSLRRQLAERHGIKMEQIVFGNGAAELLHAAAYRLLSPGDELVTPWPSYRLYPPMALRAGARPVTVDLTDGAADLEALLAAVGERTRVVVICNPNDPTGTYLDAETLGGFVSRLPDNVYVLLDEAYVQFQDVEPEDSALPLLEAFPRLLVFRTFSKIYGLSGLRAGYVVGSPAAASVLGSIVPALGVNVLTQAAVGQALRIGDEEIARRRQMVIEQRVRLLGALRDMPVSAPPSQANFLWLAAEGIDGAELADRLEQAHVRVAAGGPLGDDRHVRVAIANSAATDRVLWALGQAVEAGPDGRPPERG